MGLAGIGILKKATENCVLHPFGLIFPSHKFGNTEMEQRCDQDGYHGTDDNG